MAICFYIYLLVCFFCRVKPSSRPENNRETSLLRDGFGTDGQQPRFADEIAVYRLRITLWRFQPIPLLQLDGFIGQPVRHTTAPIGYFFGSKHSYNSNYRGMIVRKNKHPAPPLHFFEVGSFLAQSCETDCPMGHRGVDAVYPAIPFETLGEL